jgi:uncharacterized protein (TIGR03032 family)
MAEAGGSLAVTTYQANKVALLGWNGRQVTLVMREFSKPMGLAATGSRLALACRDQVFMFANVPALAHDYLQPGQYDALYLPRTAYLTGELNTHDVAFGTDGLWLVNTRFSCLSILSDTYSFIPCWHPRFVSQLTPDDRCHLNGLGMQGGQPKYVTALGETNDPHGWRPNKARGGILIDVAANQVVLRDLSMPHSPRWHLDRWWLLNSGTGELWSLDPDRGQHTVVTVLPSFVRGLCFVGPYAVVGMSRIREKHIFGDLPVQDRFDKLICGLAVIDLRTGRQTGQLEFTEGCTEVYDVQFLPGLLRPTILNLEKEASRQAITAPDFCYWLRPNAEVPPAPGQVEAGEARGRPTT